MACFLFKGMISLTRPDGEAPVGASPTSGRRSSTSGIASGATRSGTKMPSVISALKSSRSGAGPTLMSWLAWVLMFPRHVSQLWRSVGGTNFRPAVSNRVLFAMSSGWSCSKWRERHRSDSVASAVIRCWASRSSQSQSRLIEEKAVRSVSVLKVCSLILDSGRELSLSDSGYGSSSRSSSSIADVWPTDCFRSSASTSQSYFDFRSISMLLANVRI
jgi:hypothetical protein